MTGFGYFGLNKIDRELSSYLTKNGFYVELGANDGIKQSNSLVLEKYLGWIGLLNFHYVSAELSLKSFTKAKNFT